jgi:hypothetical protein
MKTSASTHCYSLWIGEAMIYQVPLIFPRNLDNRIMPRGKNVGYRIALNNDIFFRDGEFSER